MGNILKSPLSRKLALTVVVISTMIAVVTTSVQLWIEYQLSLSSVHHVFKQVEASNLSTLTSSVWRFDEELIVVQLDGITNLPEIEWAEFSSNDGSIYAAGERLSTYTLEAEMRVIHDSGDGLHDLGTLTITSSLDDLYWALASKFLFIIAMNFFKTFLVLLCILYVFYRLVGRHLHHLGTYLSGMNLKEPIGDFKLDRPVQRSAPDEFDQLIKSINTMHSNLQASFNEVTQYRDRLEQMVEERTAELGLAKGRAEAALTNLQELQEKLVEAEKMSSLGMLVAGVAHEVNTPAGVCLTAVTSLEEVRRGTQKRFAGGQLSKADLTKLFEQLELFDDLIQKNLRRIIRLVEDFKQTATNNVQAERHAFSLQGLVDDVVSPLFSKLHDDSKDITVDIADDLVIESMPGVLSQILTNLLNNSLAHAFTQGEPGRVAISADVDHDRLRLTVVDDGAGMDEATRARIFDPFFTTKRGKGGMGLGMHIVYNLVVQKLKGEIQCRSIPGVGTTFELLLPLKEPDSARLGHPSGREQRTSDPVIWSLTFASGLEPVGF